MKFIQCTAVIAIATLAFLAVSLRADDRIPVKVVVVATFDNELQNWITNLPLAQALPFPQGYRPLYYNSKLQVLGIITGANRTPRPQLWGWVSIRVSTSHAPTG